MSKFILPIYYTQEFKTKADKTFLVGLNWERNAYHFLKNQVKQHYHDLVADQADSVPVIASTYTLHTDLYYKNPQSDGRNIVPLIEKYFLDALQELGITTNDNVKFDLGGSWRVVGQDKITPRVEITLKEVNENT